MFWYFDTSCGLKDSSAGACRAETGAAGSTFQAAIACPRQAKSYAAAAVQQRLVRVVVHTAEAP